MGFLKKIGKGLKKVLPQIAAVAPTIATALGGPLAGTAAVMLKRALGKSDATDDEVAQLILGGDPDVMLKIKQGEQDFKVKMRELDITEKELEEKGTDSARKRHEKVEDKEPARLTYMAMGGLLSVVVAFVFMPEMTATQAYLFGVLTGGLLELVGKCYNFFFGSSQGSKVKSEHIAEQMAGLRQMANGKDDQE